MTVTENGAEADPRRWWILGILVLSLVVVMTANTSLNLAIPSLVEATNASPSQLQWIVDSYALVFAGFVLTAGAIGDRFGRKGALLAGLALFGAMSLLATTAESATMLIALRAVQGAGAALIMPGTLSILTAVFPPHERTRAIALWAGFAASGASFGIVGTGWLLEHFWWGSVFFVNVPVVAGAFVLVAAIVPTSRDPRGVPLDGAGAALSIVGLGALLFGIIEGPERGWADPLTIAGFAVAVVALAAFVVWERRAESPMLDLRFFTNRGFSLGTATIALTFFAMFGLWFVLTQYLQSVRGYTPLGAGIRILPMPVAMMLAAPRSARLGQRFGPRAVITTGLLAMAAALVLLANVDRDTPYWVLAAGLVVLGVGMGNVGAPATGAVMAALPVGRAGVGSAVNDTAREVGGAFGIAVMGSLLAAGYRSGVGDAVAAADLDGPATHAVEQSIGSALHEAARLGGDAGPALARAAGDAYIDAMGLALLVAAVSLAVAAVLVRRFLPTSPGPGGQPGAEAGVEEGTSVDGSPSTAASSIGTKPSSRNGRLSGVTNEVAAPSGSSKLSRKTSRPSVWTGNVS
jgi:EmrB/QacA subfamily drug resistance transporter